MVLINERKRKYLHINAGVRTKNSFTLLQNWSISSREKRVREYALARYESDTDFVRVSVSKKNSWFRSVCSRIREIRALEAKGEELIENDRSSSARESMVKSRIEK